MPTPRLAGTCSRRMPQADLGGRFASTPNTFLVTNLRSGPTNCREKDWQHYHSWIAPIVGAHKRAKKLKNMLATCARKQRIYHGTRGEAPTTAHR
jgi:hypothetical protein